MAKKLKKADLGKGIRALLHNPAKMDKAVKQNPQKVVKELAGSIALLNIALIEPNPYQPRVEFEAEALEELKASIKVHGLIQPITVRRLSEKAYQIISGERRYRASKEAGLTEVPAYIRLADDQQMLEMALIENIQRADLNPIEIAISYQRLIDECKLTHDSMSERVGKKRSTVTNYLRLLKLPPEIQRALKEKELSMGHARALAGIEDVLLQMSIYKQCREQGLSVRGLEALISRINNLKSAPKSKKPTLSKHLKGIQDQFSAYFGSKVQLKRDANGKGQIVVHFKNDAELNNLIELIEEE